MRFVLDLPALTYERLPFGSGLYALSEEGCGFWGVDRVAPKCVNSSHERIWVLDVRASIYRRLVCIIIVGALLKIYG
jgi:hypothetical protein